MKKYTPVFGPQELFDNEFEPNAIAVIFIDRTNKLHATSEAEIDRQLQRTGSYVVAMRRIIKTPVWTVEDQKAGRLPEVGSKLICTETWDAFEFVGVIAGSMRWACKDFQDGFLYFFEQSEMSPIESPEEKAQRLEDEFINYVLHHEKSQINSSEELVAAKRAIKLAYKLQLSGELQAPKGGE